MICSETIQRNKKKAQKTPAESKLENIKIYIKQADRSTDRYTVCVFFNVMRTPVFRADNKRGGLSGKSRRYGFDYTGDYGHKGKYL